MSRELFAVVPERVLQDERIQRAAVALAASGLTGDDFAEPAIVGILASLSLRQLRAGGENGIIVGDPTSFIRHALGVGPRVAASILDVLVSAGLLEAGDSGHVIVGYDDIYAPILLVRSKDAARKRAEREERKKAEATGSPAGPEDVRRTSGGLSDASAPSSVSRDPSPGSPTSTTKAPRPSAAGPASPPEAGTGGSGNDSPKKPRRDLRLPVEVLLAEKGVHLSGRVPGITTWRKFIRQKLAAGTTEAEVVALIAAAPPDAAPWDVFPRGGARQGGRLPQVGTKYQNIGTKVQVNGGAA